LNNPKNEVPVQSENPPISLVHAFVLAPLSLIFPIFHQMTYIPIRHRILIAFLLLLPFAGLFGQVEDSTEGGEFDNVEVIINNETAINSDRLEFSPAFYENGIVFISTRVAGRQYKVMDKDLRTNIMSIFIARRDASGQLQTPEPFAQSLLSTVHEGPLTFNAQNDVIYFTRNNINEKGKPQKASDGKYKLKIYSADKSGSAEWSNVRDLPFNSSEFNTAHPSISADGDRLYFASDRPGGLGGMDIYVVTKDGNAWGAPVNLGPEVNTPGNEIFPFIHADGSLFFTSDGRNGLGGLDIYYSVRSNENWSTPVNFALLNSSADDFGMIIDRDKKNGYFSSNRSGGLGEDDIYRFFVLGDLRQVPEEEDVAEDYMVQVNDKATGLPIEGADVKGLLLDQFTILKAITLADRPLEKDEILLRIPFDESASSGSTNAAGGYTVRLEPGSHIFKIMKPGYTTKRVVMNTKEMEGKVIFVDMNEGSSDSEEIEDPFDQYDRDSDWGLPDLIDSGTVFQLPNIYYNFNDASIRPDARTDLDYLADFLLKFTGIQIELASHTDSRGSDVYNLNLSQERAENAAQYLISRGVEQDRIIPVGYGETRLRNDCVDDVPCSEAKHQFNRRTEVRILKMGDPINLTIVNEVTEPEVIDYPDLLTDISEDERAQGRYQVVAGSFKSEANAQARLKTVKDLGYTSARVLFNPSNDLHVVLVEVFQFKSDGLELVERLRGDGMESFLKVQ